MLTGWKVSVGWKDGQIPFTRRELNVPGAVALLLLLLLLLLLP